MNDTQQIKHVHFIGVGGVGMSGIASVAHDQGLTVSGSDLRQSRYTDQLVDAGITVFIGQSASNLASLESVPDVVVVSTAIMETNEELAEAKRLNIPIWHRARMLAYLGKELKTLAVAGTHGKTTTSSMLAFALDALSQDPTFLIGGMVRSYGTNARSGQGPYYVVEADESDKSFTYLSPESVIVTNIEADHLDHYEDLDEIFELFAEFISSVPQDGYAVVCGEQPHLVEVARNHANNVLTYGFGDTFDTNIRSYEQKGIESVYALDLPDGSHIEGKLKQNPGRHYILNVAAVLTLIDALGLDAQRAATALEDFGGVKRRFDLVGKCREITIVDDYAHHPTEISSTIAAAKCLGYNHVHVLFQPHRYTRAKLFCEVLKDEFSHAFDLADSVTFMNVYSAGETPIPGITGKTFLNTVLSNPDHPQAYYVAKRIDTVPSLMQILEPGDLIITMGAGDVTSVGPELLFALQELEEESED